MARIQGFLEAYEYTQYNMTILDITKAKFPVMAAIMLVSIFLIPRFAPDVKNDKEISASGPKQAEPLDPVREVIGYVTFILVLLGLIFASKLGLTTWQVAMMGAGNYHVKDLVKMGALPAVIITVVAVGWIMTIYPIF